MSRRFRHTKIVCTLGPASESPEVIDGLLRAGMNVARFNFSHGSHEYHGRMMQLLRDRAEKLGVEVALLLDTRGPEIRTGDIEGDGEILLRQGEEIVLTTETVPGTSQRLSISYEPLPREVSAGDRIYIADGRIELDVLETAPPEIRCAVRTGGQIGGRKNVNIPGIRYAFDAMTESDRADIAFGVGQRIDFVAASFVRKPSDVVAIRAYLDELGSNARIIAKIEDQEGVDSIDGIIDVSDAIMIARGDLGVQLPTEQIPLVQKRIIRKTNAANRAVIVATQMLDSMIRDSRPTRAELTDVANAIFDGTDAVMLSGETASGAFPVQAVETMDRIARTVEESEEYRLRPELNVPRSGDDIAISIARSACSLAEAVGAAAIVCPTLRGNTPRVVSSFRPGRPIIAATSSAEVSRRLLLYWGILPIVTELADDSESMVQNAIGHAMRRGLAGRLDRLVSVAGVPVNSPIMMNSIRLHILGTVLAKGKQGHGPLRSGRVVRIAPDAVPPPVASDEVALLKTLEPSQLESLEAAAAIIVERKSPVHGEWTWDIAGRESGPTIVLEVEDAFESLEEGAMVTVDGEEKLIYDGLLM